MFWGQVPFIDKQFRVVHGYLGICSALKQFRSNSLPKAAIC